jgi:hypothetical protein
MVTLRDGSGVIDLRNIRNRCRAAVTSHANQAASVLRLRGKVCARRFRVYEVLRGQSWLLQTTTLQASPDPVNLVQHQPSMFLYVVRVKNTIHSTRMRTIWWVRLSRPKQTRATFEHLRLAHGCCPPSTASTAPPLGLFSNKGAFLLLTMHFLAHGQLLPPQEPNT